VSIQFNAFIRVLIKRIYQNSKKL